MKYHAFISYSHTDAAWGAWLHRALETYRPPKSVRRQLPIEAPPRLFPIFRDREELPTSPDLASNIREALADSRFLIVICSPAAAHSRWVNEEIKTYKQLGRADHILALIVAGEPNASDTPGKDPAEECFPEALRYAYTPEGERTDARVEPIAADVRAGKDGKRAALLKLAAPMFGVSYDTLRQRDQERQRRQRLLTGAASLVLLLTLGGLGWNAYRLSALRRVEHAQQRLERAQQRRERAQSEFRMASHSAEGGDLRNAMAWAARAIRDDPSVDASRALGFSLLNSAAVAVWAVKQRNFVSSARFSPDGQRLVTASGDSTAQIWDAHTGATLGGPLRHHSFVNSAAFSPDEQRVVTASADSTAQVWDAQTGARLGIPLKHHNVVLSAAFSSDGQRVVTASEDSTAQIWDARTGANLLLLRCGSFVNSAAFSPDGRRVVTASWDTAQVWDAHTGAKVGSPLLAVGDVWSAAFSPDGGRVLTVSWPATVIWDVRSGAKLAEMHARNGAQTNTAVFSPDGERVVTTSTDGGAQVWDARSGAALGPPLWRAHRANSLAFSPDGERLVVAARDSTAEIWDVQTGATLSRSYPSMEALAMSRDGQRVVTQSSGVAQVWDVRTGAALTPRLWYGQPVSSAAFSDNGGLVVTASFGTGQIWDGHTGAKLGASVVYGTPTLPSFSPDGRRVVTAGSDGVAQIWDARTGAKLPRSFRHANVVSSAVFSRDGARVLTVSANAAQIWDVRTGAKLGEPVSEFQMTSAMFSPEGQRVLTVSGDGTAEIWDIKTKTKIAPSIGHHVNSATFSPDGRRVLTVSEDSVQIWDVRSGTKLGDPFGAGHGVNFAAFSLDDMRVLTAAGNKVRVWDAEVGRVEDAELMADFLEAAAQAHIDAGGAVAQTDARTAARAIDRLLLDARADSRAPPGAFARWEQRRFFSDRDAHPQP